ncbi:MAG: DUF418 domain-containing protein [Porticoccaceae bacterium]|nr:DUF418 domain-containing protein [Porticoccaceae bacterium]
MINEVLRQASKESLVRGPTPENARLASIDIIRGIAVLGILLVNIQTFAMISSALSNPLSFGDFSGSNRAVYYFTHFFAEQKFMTIFAVLFGTGFFIMTSGAEQKQLNSAFLHFRRMSALALLGLMHLYLLWYGDILFVYSVAGMVIYFFRHKSPRFLLLWALLLLAINAVFFALPAAAMSYMNEADLHELLMVWRPDELLIESEIIANQSSWIGQMDHRHAMADDMLVNGLFYGCRVLGLMMIGIALFKIDFFGHRFTRKSLQLQGLIFFILGAFIICARINSNIAKEFPIEAIFSLENYWGSLLLAYSYMCWILAFSRSQLFPSAKRALANVGRMALTNYISQTLICGFIFYGWGLGKFGSFNRIEQIYVVVVIWIFQIACSHSWMQRFQFGPLEWILRSITYGRMQTIKRP